MAKWRVTDDEMRRGKLVEQPGIHECNCGCVFEVLANSKITVMRNCPDVEAAIAFADQDSDFDIQQHWADEILPWYSAWE